MSWISIVSWVDASATYAHDIVPCIDPIRWGVAGSCCYFTQHTFQASILAATGPAMPLQQLIKWVLLLCAYPGHSIACMLRIFHWQHWKSFLCAWQMLIWMMKGWWHHVKCLNLRWNIAKCLPEHIYESAGVLEIGFGMISTPAAIAHPANENHFWYSCSPKRIWCHAQRILLLSLKH